MSETTEEAVLRLHAEATKGRVTLQPWQEALLKRIAVMSEDERLIVCMPREHATPLVYKIVLSAQDQVMTKYDLFRIEEQLAYPDHWMKPT